MVDQEYDRLKEAVQEIFRQVTPKRFAVPSDDNCGMVALYLMALRQNIKKKPQPKIFKSGKDFKRDLEDERREVAGMLSLARAPGIQPPSGKGSREQQALLERIDQTLANIDWMGPRLGPQDSYREPIRQIAVCARQAWQEANDGQAPKAMNPNDPLCQFVVKALDAIGHPRSAETVSAVLRGKRRNKGRRDKIDS